MKLITTKNEYNYWLGTSKGRPIFNVSPKDQKPSVTGYRDLEYLQRAKGYRLDLSIFAPYVITKERVKNKIGKGRKKKPRSLR